MADTRTNSELDLALEPAAGTGKTCGVGIGACYYWQGFAASVDGAPALAALAPPANL